MSRILAYKFATPSADRPLAFTPLSSPVTYGVVDRAVCDEHPEPPTEGCHDGFFACRPDVLERVTRQSLWRRTAGPVLLAVELWGKVLELDRGWRASHQRVVAAAVHARCGRGLWCATPGLRAGQTTHAAQLDHGPCLPLCAPCADIDRTRHPVFSLEELGQRWGLEVRAVHDAEELDAALVRREIAPPEPVGEALAVRQPVRAEVVRGRIVLTNEGLPQDRADSDAPVLLGALSGTITARADGTYSGGTLHAEALQVPGGCPDGCAGPWPALVSIDGRVRLACARWAGAGMSVADATSQLGFDIVGSGSRQRMPSSPVEDR